MIEELTAMAHTPGPWTVETDDEGVYVLMGKLKGDDEHLAVYAAPYNADSDYGSHFPSGRRIADAFLIAAAPDLLSALERTLLRLKQYGNVPVRDMAETIGEAERALARARGAQGGHRGA